MNASLSLKVSLMSGALLIAACGLTAVGLMTASAVTASVLTPANPKVSKNQALPQLVPAAPQQASVASRRERPAPKTPVASQLEPAAPQLAPVASRLEPAASRLETAAPQLEPATFEVYAADLRPPKQTPEVVQSNVTAVQSNVDVPATIGRRTVPPQAPAQVSRPARPVMFTMLMLGIGY